MITTLNQWKMIKESMDSNDNIDLLLKVDNEKPQIVNTKDWYIDSIIDVVVDNDDIEMYENIINTTNDLNIQTYKQGDEIYLTVLVKPRNHSTIQSGGEIAVAKVKIQKIWYGTSKIAELQKKGKLL